MIVWTVLAEPLEMWDTQSLIYLVRSLHTFPVAPIPKPEELDILC